MSARPGQSLGRLLIAEDERVIARDMSAILCDAGYEIVEVVQTAEEVPAAIQRHRPELVLLDIGLAGERDGVEMARRIDAPVLFVSGRADDLTLDRVREVQARGFVVKPFSPRQLVAAVHLALSSQPEDDPKDAQRALASIVETLERAGVLDGATASSGIRIRPVAGLDLLSDREREVLDELVAHRRPPQIAKLLHISPHTVRNHLKSIYAKLDVHSQAELLEKIIERD